MGRGSIDAEEARRMGYDYINPGMFGQWMGLVTLLGGIREHGAAPQVLGIFVLVLSTTVMIVGCGRLAAYHGFSRSWGWLGLLNFIGLFTLNVAIPRAGTAHQTSGFEVIHAKPYQRDVWRMDVKVLLDATCGLNINEPIQLQIARGADITTAMKSLEGVLPPLGALKPQMSYRINGQPAEAKDELSDGDELSVALGKKETPRGFYPI